MEEAPKLPVRKTETLYSGRFSNPQSTYFVTWVTGNRLPWLKAPEHRRHALKVLQAWHAERDGDIVATVVMPNHLHVLFELGQRLTLGRTVSKWKSEIRKRCSYKGKWQRDYWDHRLRPIEKVEDYARYIFLNPYRAGLINPDEIWPSWWAPEPSKFSFSSALSDDGTPPPEWIQGSDDVVLPEGWR